MITATTSKFKMAVEIGVFRLIREALYFCSTITASTSNFCGSFKLTCQLFTRSLLIYDYHSKELCTPFYGNEKFAFVIVWQHIQNHDSFIIQCNILRLTANYGKLRKKVIFLLLLQFFEQLNEFLTCYTYKLSKKRNGGEILNF